MLAFGITLVDMSSQLAKQIPTRLKEIMLNYVTTWHAWLVNHVASLVVRMRSNALSSYLPIASTAGNFTSRGILTIQLM